MMNTRPVLPLLLLIACAFPLSAQYAIKFKLQLLDDHPTYGVYATTDDEISENTITGSGQATFVMPISYQWGNTESVSGLWMADATVISPSQNPTVKYVSFGLVTAEPTYRIKFKKGVETLLFTFQGLNGCPEYLRLIDCGTPNVSDPFCPELNIPCSNCPNSNPNNDLSVIDFGFSGARFFNFQDLYAPAAWDCHDNDGDGKPNALEDTNGNGVFDPGIDSSDLNQPFAPGPGPVKKVVVGQQVAVEGMIVNPNENAWSVEATSLYSQNKDNLTLTLTPNPANEVITVDFGPEPTATFSKLYVMDMQGRTVQMVPAGEMVRASLDISQMQPGIYIVALETDGRFSERRKLVKE